MVGGIVSTCTVGAANGVLDIVSYSVTEDMRSPSILCLSPPNVVMTATLLA